MHPRNDPVVLLLRQYWLEALQPMAFVSVPALTDEGVHIRYFQVLRLEPAAIVPHTFDTDDDPEDPVLFKVAVQEWERLAEIQQDPADPGIHADVFSANEEPFTIDLLRLCGCNPWQRHRFLQWESGPSEVDGCLALRNPVVARPLMGLAHPRVPCLTLMDALHAKGFVGQRGLVVHRPGGALVYDDRRLASKRGYLKCILSSEELYGAGVRSTEEGVLEEGGWCPGVQNKELNIGHERASRGSGLIAT